MEWTSNGPRSNLESGLVPGGRSLSLTEVSLNYRLAPVITNEVTVDARRSQSLSSSAGADINSVLGGGSGTQGAIQVPAQSVLEFRLQQPLSIKLEDGA